MYRQAGVADPSIHCEPEQLPVLGRVEINELRRTDQARQYVVDTPRPVDADALLAAQAVHRFCQSVGLVILVLADENEKSRGDHGRVVARLGVDTVEPTPRHGEFPLYAQIRYDERVIGWLPNKLPVLEQELTDHCEVGDAAQGEKRLAGRVGHSCDRGKNIGEVIQAPDLGLQYIERQMLLGSQLLPQ